MLASDGFEQSRYPINMTHASKYSKLPPHQMPTQHSNLMMSYNDMSAGQIDQSHTDARPSNPFSTNQGANLSGQNTSNQFYRGTNISSDRRWVGDHNRNDQDNSYNYTLQQPMQQTYARGTSSDSNSSDSDDSEFSQYSPGQQVVDNLRHRNNDPHVGVVSYPSQQTFQGNNEYPSQKQTPHYGQSMESDPVGYQRYAPPGQRNDVFIKENDSESNSDTSSDQDEDYNEGGDGGDSYSSSDVSSSTYDNNYSRGYIGGQ